jgi:manganese-dependent inorganic pyrophosphatase
MNNSDNKVYIVGHRNPDTDSICAAMGYAYVKNMIDPGRTYIPCRAGSINEETAFVLDRFGATAPEYLGEVRTQIEDIDIRISHGVPEDASLRKAWDLMKARNIVTLPIVADEHLKGIITIKDIGRVYLDNNRADLLADAQASYQNVIEVLDGQIIIGDKNARITKGKTFIGAAEADILADYVEDGDSVIVANREESQRVAIKNGAGCVIITMDSPVSDAIKQLARERNCVVISTAYDTYIVARLLNQSLPVRYGMISEGLITFEMEDYLEDVKKVMAKTGHRDFPVIDKEGHYSGMISRRFLIDAKGKQVILVDHNERSQAVNGIEEADILEIIDHHRLGNIETLNPVYFRNQPVGSTSTIIYQMGVERCVKFDSVHAGLLCAGVISDTLFFRSPTTTEMDKEAAAMLAEIAHIDLESYATEMFHAGSAPGKGDSESMILRDFKTYTLNSVTLGIGQINFMDGETLTLARDKLIAHLGKVREEKEIDMIFVMLTNISANGSVIIFDGEDAEELLTDAFEKHPADGYMVLDEVVSRKKQFVPEILSALQN